MATVGAEALHVVNASLSVKAKYFLSAPAYCDKLIPFFETITCFPRCQPKAVIVATVLSLPASAGGLSQPATVMHL